MDQAFDWTTHGVVALLAAAVAAFLVTLLLVAKSAKDFTHAGPQIQEIGRQLRGYMAYAVARLASFTFAITMFLALVGVLVHVSYCVLFGGSPTFLGMLFSGLLAIAVIGFVQFCTHLLHIPGSIAASSHYRMSRFYGLWRLLSPRRLAAARAVLALVVAGSVLGGMGRLAASGAWREVAGLAFAAVAILLVVVWAAYWPEPKPVRKGQAEPDPTRPNIVMIGCDTLRSDRIADAAYPRKLAPNIEALAEHGALFSNCYVPLARTAPSLLSYMTGTWPHVHGIRDNFAAGAETRITLPSLATLLRDAGYQTAAISDWAGSDLGKYTLGFEHTDLPEDQWNAKYLIRQGPKDIRLFLSLFTHNRFGKKFLPELYYLAGVPLTRHLGKTTRNLIRRFSEEDRPFFINLFMATTHPPFGSEHPFYTLFSDPAYAGESKFVMCKLTDPLEIIRSQREPKEAFDLDQIIDLYDGCVRSFDDEVGRIVHYLRDSGLERNTLLVVYSDHGMEFFEHGTWGQGNSALGDFSARVPLLIVDPRRTGNGGIPYIVRTVDLAPTLLDLTGLPVPDSMSGVSLANILDEDHEDPSLSAYFETGIWLTTLPGTHPEHVRYPDLLDLLEVSDPARGTLGLKPQYRDLIIEARDRMIRSGNWLLVYLPLRNGALYQLFDLARDPGCEADVADRFPEVVQELKTNLISWMRQDKQRTWNEDHLKRRS